MMKNSFLALAVVGLFAHPVAAQTLAESADKIVAAETAEATAAPMVDYKKPSAVKAMQWAFVASNVFALDAEYRAAHAPGGTTNFMTKSMPVNVLMRGAIAFAGVKLTDWTSKKDSEGTVGFLSLLSSLNITYSGTRYGLSMDLHQLYGK